jgi:nucleotide-binding universal stress UspA family protein
VTAVVVGLVDRPEGWAALEVAVRESVVHGSSLVIVCSGVDDATFSRMRPRIEATVREHDSAVPWQVNVLAVGNSPVDDLVATVEKHAAELLVIGLRRRSNVGKFLMGSDAQRILMLAQCPVLAVKA